MPKADAKQPEHNQNVLSLKGGSLEPAEFRIHKMHTVIPQSHTLADLLQPAYWKHEATKLVPGSHVYCTWEDSSRFVWLVVISSGKLWAKVKVLMDKPLDISDEEMAKLKDSDSPFEVVWGGLATLHIVRRKSDQETIEKGFKSQEEAVEWMLQFEKSQER